MRVSGCNKGGKHSLSRLMLIMVVFFIAWDVHAADVVLYKGKMWQQADDSIKRNWHDAKTYCQNLTLGGNSEWRLPAISEFKGIIQCKDGEKVVPHPLLNKEPCNSQADYYRIVKGYDLPSPFRYEIPTIPSVFQSRSSLYWSSTVSEEEGFPNGISYPMYIYFGNGYAGWTYTYTDTMYVRCVSDNISQPAPPTKKSILPAIGVLLDD